MRSNYAVRRICSKTDEKWDNVTEKTHSNYVVRRIYSKTHEKVLWSRLQPPLRYDECNREIITFSLKERPDPLALITVLKVSCKSPWLMADKAGGVLGHLGRATGYYRLIRYLTEHQG